MLNVNVKPAPWSSEAHEHVREEGNSIKEAAVSSNCTQVSVGHLTEKSCSEIYPMNVYPAGQQEIAARLYAILDDQSNCLLVRSEFFELFDIKHYNSPQSLKNTSVV